MPGLLDSLAANPEGFMALAGGLLGGNVGGAFTGYQQATSQAREQALRAQLINAQIAETQAQAQERTANARRLQLAQEQALREQQGIPGLYRQPGMTGGAAVPASLGDVPMFGQPMGATPMQRTPGGFDVQGAFKLGITDPKRIAELAALADIGRQEVARTMKGIGPDGREFEYQTDKWGNKIGDGLPQYRAPLSVNQGDRTTFADPYSLKPMGEFRTNQSPDSVASNATSMRGQNMVDARSREANQMGRVPTGYRQLPDGSLTFIVGGPADPNAAKKAAPTEFQSKSTTYGARMQDAANTLGALEGKVSPSSVAQAGYRPEFPNWLPGGQILGAGIAAANRGVTNDDAQRYYQAQENWVTANLRQESGAAIGKDEMAKDIAKWFPQPNDPSVVVKQKADARKVAERAMLVQAGPGASQIPDIVSGGNAKAQAAPTLRWNPKTQKVEPVGQ